MSDTVFAPCLLDELMDNQVITCDIDFGSAVFSVKGSPSHESDSGCSDMSEEVRSVSPDFDHGEVVFPELESLDCDAFDNELDQELQSYLNAPIKSQQGESREASGVQVRPAVATVGSDIEVDDDLDPDYEPPKKTKADRMPPVVHTKPKKYIPTPTPEAEICVLPSKSTSTVFQGSSTDKNNNAAARPAVKVVKVIKTPATSSEDIGSHLMQALDERNKKNAKQAKINREKKKMYIQTLEEEIVDLQNENKILKRQQESFVSEKKEMEEELDYLRNVLANQSALSGLLKNIGNTKGVSLSSSFTRKRSAEMDHDYDNSQKRRKTATAGVCLHVHQDNVSLEFCSKCANMAKSSGSNTEDNS